MYQSLLSFLKTEFEEQKQAELENLRRSFTSEQEEKERSYTGKMSQLTAQLQQLDAVVAQVLNTYTHAHIKILPSLLFLQVLHYVHENEKVKCVAS